MSDKDGIKIVRATISEVVDDKSNSDEDVLDFLDEVIDEASARRDALEEDLPSVGYEE